MMNEKVTQMVALLFKDTAPSEEVRALHDEVLNNCQERYADLVASGLSEEESLAAVMESLKGMEEVLKEYPRKETAEDAPQEEKKGPSLFNFTPEDIRAIDAQLTSCDMEVLQSEAGFSMEITGDVRMNLEKDGTLRLWQEKVSDSLMKGISWEKSLDSFEHFGDALNQLGQNLSRLFSKGLDLSGEGHRTVQLDLSGKGCRAVLRLPRGLNPDVSIRTTGGDILWDGPVPGGKFILRSTGGDVTVRTDPDYLLPSVQVSTMSGDAELSLSAEEARISTVSGDIAWEGSAGKLEIQTTSGDAEAEGSFREIGMNSTSGDLNLELTEDRETEILLNSVSGDLSLRLPQGVQEMTASLKSVSGEIVRRGVELTEDARIRVRANTVSGDLRVRG